MANPTTNFGWQMPTSTDLVTDLPADFEVFGQAVDTSLVDLKGGTTGQVLSKASNTDMDFTWVAQDDSNAIQNAIVDAKGDLITATAADTPARLAVGTNGQTLVADSSTATGLKWATPATTGFVGARVYKSASQAITTATFTEVSWDTEAFDTDGFHDNATNNNRFTIPAGKAGYYRVEYQLQPYNTTENYWKLMKNGSTVYSGDYAQVGGTTGQVWFSYVASLAVADYISFQYAQYTGVNKNIQATGGSYAQIQYLGA